MAIDPTICFLLHDTARLWGKTFDQFARELALPRAQAKAIAYLIRNEGINQRQLAELLEVEPISLARMIDRLAAAGLVERRIDPGDRRVWRLYVTDAARRLFEHVETVADQVQAQALAGFSPSESDLLMSFLARLHGNLSDRDGGADASCPSLPSL